MEMTQKKERGEKKRNLRGRKEKKSKGSLFHNLPPSQNSKHVKDPSVPTPKRYGRLNEIPPLKTLFSHQKEEKI